MSCCGQARRAAASSIGSSSQQQAAQPVPFQKTYGPSAGGVTFEYRGARSLTVTGQGTGAQYRFDGRGSRVNVDARDRASLLPVPGLREVSR